LRKFLILAALMAGLAPALAAHAQITFQSAEVIGTRDSVRAAAPEGPVPLPTRQEDKTVRFWSDDGKTYRLEGFGCRFQMSGQPGAPDEMTTQVADLLKADIDTYRQAATAAAGGAMATVYTGALYRVAPGKKSTETYGLDCSDKVATAVALDVQKTRGPRKLSIFVIQINLEDLAAGRPPRKTMLVAFSQNTLFRKNDPETLARATPVTRDLFEALTR